MQLTELRVKCNNEGVVVTKGSPSVTAEVRQVMGIDKRSEGWPRGDGIIRMTALWLLAAPFLQRGRAVDIYEEGEAGWVREPKTLVLHWLQIRSPRLRWSS